jgi:hypothetical protein
VVGSVDDSAVAVGVGVAVVDDSALAVGVTGSLVAVHPVRTMAAARHRMMARDFT